MPRLKKHHYLLQDVQLQKLYQYAMMLCQQSDDAYDLVQSSLEKYIQQVNHAPEEITEPLAYVRRLIRNRFIDLYRYQQRWGNESFEESGTYDISPVILEEWLVDLDQLEKIWIELSPQDRDVLYHWAVLGYSTDEACERLEMPRGTFLSRLHRLRKKLQGDLPDKIPKEQSQ
ncbi:RNA polymerase sigma factor [Algicola sagamiensis]|uniref:RNA polymerase sigma factor n=1 Tax=Algicola sagamiensis TaxID=163869 RepID=UPI0003603D8A|nr:RNA polymerase sigma factor [Algicola sagamiensis]